MAAYVEQCKDDHYQETIEQQKGEGCRMYGHLQVNKVVRKSCFRCVLCAFVRQEIGAAWTMCTFLCVHHCVHRDFLRGEHLVALYTSTIENSFRSQRVNLKGKGYVSCTVNQHHGRYDFEYLNQLRQ
jgi:hypothetical protein